MVNIEDAYPSNSNWLRASDLKKREINVTISGSKMEDVGSDHKLVVYFKGKDKGLALNKTNANNIALAYGKETDLWVGKDIILYPAMVDFQGKTVEAIRVRPQLQRDELDEEVPF